MNIIQTMTDPNLFARPFADATFSNWRALVAGFYGLPLDDEQAEVFHQLTQRAPTGQPFDELWLVIGRRGGKSNVSALLAVYEAFFNDYSDKLAPGEVATVMVIAADRKQARSVMRYIRGLIEASPMLQQMVIRDNQESIELVNRCVIEIMTASHRGSRGYSAACVICDEIAFWLSEGANPDAEVINAIRPSLGTLGGKLIALSSPYARRGVLWTAYRNYFGKADSKRVLVAKAPTEIMNPTLPKHIIEQAYEEDPASAAAEYGANFRTDVETFISREAIDAVVIPDRIELAPAQRNYYTAFVDAAGGSGQDSMTCAIAHKDGEKVIIDAVRAVKPPFSPEAVVTEFCQLFMAYRVKHVTGDRWGGDFVQEQFKKRGIGYQPSDKTKSELYAELLPLINSQRVELPDIRRLKDELAGLERRTSRTGKDSIDHAPGQHDDLINAAAGALVMANSFKVQMAGPRVSR